MHVILVLLLLGAIYLFLDAGLVFFALIVGVALLLGLISSSFSSRERGPSSAKSPPAPPQFVKQDHQGLQKFWITVGRIFNFLGKGIYRFLVYGFQAGGKKSDE